ncbi:MAG: ATP-binding protein [Methanobacteriota archaeon]
MTENIQILYIDDDPVICDIAKRTLEKATGCTVTPAESASDAIHLLTEKTFDAIISDYEMEGMNGIELLKYLREKGDTIPFIIFTGEGREDVVIEALNNGADFYLEKGGQPKALFADLSNKIDSVVSRRRTEKELFIKNEELQAAYKEIAATEGELRSRLDELSRQDAILKVSEERLLMAQEIGQTGCWEYNVKTNKMWGSAEALRIFGFSPIAGDFPIEKIESCIPDRERVHQALVDLISIGREYTLEYRIHPADGSDSKIIYSIARLVKDTEENSVRVMGIIQDITERRRVEDLLFTTNAELIQRNHDLTSIRTELARLNESLEDRVNERTRDLVESERRIKLLLNQKDQFIYQLAHDLRTPLTPVVAMLPLLTIGIQDPDAKSLLEIFNQSIENLAKMVEDIIYYAQINQQYSINDYAEYFLQDLITDALDVHAFLIEQKELTIENRTSTDLMIRLSRSQAHQLFRNLLNNAVKFNAFKGRISIETHANKKWVTVQISDTGIGIPQEKLEQIWEELSTGDTSRRDPESKGMGLPIVKRIITLHGGSIEVSSQGTGKGTTFKLRLPVDQVPDYSNE